MPVDSQRALLVFRLTGQSVALPLENVQRLALMAQLARPPGLPSSLEGILNLAGTAVPVLRLDRLLHLPAADSGLYSMLIILKGISDGWVAVRVDRVTGIVSVPETTLVPVGREDTFNGCAEAAVRVEGQTVHLLSPGRILLERERERLIEFQVLVSQRLETWEAEKQ